MDTQTNISPITVNPQHEFTSSASLRLYFTQIINRISLFNPNQDLPEQFLELHRNLKDYSKFRDEEGNSIFDLETDDGNNLLLACLIKDIKPIAIEIVRIYGNLFDLGDFNREGQTALIISIKNNWFTFAAFLIGYCSDNPSKNISFLNIEKLDDHGKNALDYFFEKDKTRQIMLTKFQLFPDAPYKQLSILVNLLNFFLEFYPNDIKTHHYIDIICQDLPFYMGLLDFYIRHNLINIKFTKEFCKPIQPASSSIYAKDIKTNIPNLRRNPRQLTAQEFKHNIAIPDTSFNYDENDSDDERIELNPKPNLLPTPLPEYDPSNPGKILTYPNPLNEDVDLDLQMDEVDDDILVPEEDFKNSSRKRNRNLNNQTNEDITSKKKDDKDKDNNNYFESNLGGKKFTKKLKRKKNISKCYRKKSYRKKSYRKKTKKTKFQRNNKNHK